MLIGDSTKAAAVVITIYNFGFTQKKKNVNESLSSHNSNSRPLQKTRSKALQAKKLEPEF